MLITTIIIALSTMTIALNYVLDYADDWKVFENDNFYELVLRIGLFSVWAMICSIIVGVSIIVTNIFNLIW